jgi:hypothetical protein
VLRLIVVPEYNTRIIVIKPIETVVKRRVFLIAVASFSISQYAIMIQKPMDEANTKRSFIKTPIGKNRFEAIDKAAK